MNTAMNSIPGNIDRLGINGQPTGNNFGGLFINGPHKIAIMASLRSWALHALRALFSERTTLIVAFVCIVAMMWHLATIGVNDEGAVAVGRDGLRFTPWLAVWAFKAFRMPMPKE